MESQVEIDALHFAVGDPIEARTDLIVDRQPNGVADGLVLIGWPERLRMVFDAGEELFQTNRKKTSFRSLVVGISKAMPS